MKLPVVVSSTGSQTGGYGYYKLEPAKVYNAGESLTPCALRGRIFFKQKNERATFGVQSVGDKPHPNNKYETISASRSPHLMMRALIIFYILHYIGDFTFQNAAKNINCMSTDALIPL